MPTASSCLLHVLCFTETQYQTESKRDKKWMENYFGIFVIFGRKNQRETVPEVATRVAHATTPGGHAPHPRGPLVRRLLLFFGRKKANIWKKSWRRFQSNRSYGSPVIKEMVKGQNLGGRNRERQRQIQSRRGSRPSHPMETKDQRVNPSPI